RNPQQQAQDLMVVDFWERVYLPYCEKEWKGTGMRASTISGYMQVWNQHLKKHFSTLTLQAYTADHARRFLSSLKTKYGKNTLRHIRALASAMFSEVVERGLRDDNPWRVKLPKIAKNRRPLSTTRWKRLRTSSAHCLTTLMHSLCWLCRATLVWDQQRLRVCNGVM